MKKNSLGIKKMANNGAIWETTHEGKLEGMKSIGTCCTINPYCLKRMKDGNSICSHCFAEKYVKMRKTLREHLEVNAKILSQTLLEEREIPVTNEFIYRFEAFGDLLNETHLKNFINICNRNPYTTFALWTKNIWFLDEVFNNQNIEKPSNLIIVASSPFTNKIWDFDYAKYKVDHLFTVYTPDYAQTHDIKINCGGNQCRRCRRCYELKVDEFYINELIK